MLNVGYKPLTLAISWQYSRLKTSADRKGQGMASARHRAAPGSGPTGVANLPLPRLEAEYILPLKWADTSGDDELVSYLEELSQWVDITIVDGSAPPVFAEHRRRFGPLARHLPPEGVKPPNGKVHGVLTGIRHARHERIVIADDDVRYSRQNLGRALDLLEQADLVRVQNYFDPLPWHAKWDSARSLINRAFGSDYPGTLVVRRSLVAGGYRGDVLFENLEMIRTVLARGGTEVRADDLLVRRLPPQTAHFLGQRVRQAYDSQAQPVRLLVELSLLPLLACLARKPARLLLFVAGTVVLAAWGRRGTQGVFPWSTAMFAPLWVAERAITSWIALGWRLAGGVPYAGGKLKHAASSLRDLRRAQSGF